MLDKCIGGISLIPTQVSGTALVYYLRGKTEVERAALAAQWEPTGVRAELTDKQLCAVFGITGYRLHHTCNSNQTGREWRLKKLMRSCGTDVSWDTLVRVMG
jgi:hypothetical protein